MNNFENLGLSPKTLKALDQLGFTTPTPVQTQAIPLLLENDPCDFIGLAQTGTGKTAAFGLPLVELIDSDNPTTQALIMAPTRELGQQTAKQLVDFSKGYKDLNVEVVYGGAAITNQIKALRRPTQIVVATPGRLLDLIKRKSIKLNNISHVVLDEADEMLNMGFKEAIDEILSHTPDTKSTWLFSATMPPEIRKIINKYMVEPKEVTINREEKSNKDITHQYVITKSANKVAALRRFLDIQPEMRGVMFCRTRRETQQIADELNDLGYSTEPLHGELSQQQRDAAMKRFKSRSMQLLIATDVAARGIDVNDLTHVIHHTLPDQLESYTHRSGRTGRAGKKGVSLAFINPREGRKIQALERKINVKFEQMEVPDLNSIQEGRLKNWSDSIINVQVDSKSEKLFEEVKHAFEGLSKEDILKRIISSQLENLISSDGQSDLNESIGGSPDRRDRSQFNRYFINLGSIDGMSKGEIVSFVSEIGQIETKFFGSVEIKQNHTYFEMDKRYDKGVSTRFKNVTHSGREIRMNRDNDNSSSDKKGKKKYRSDRNSSRKDFRRGKRRRK
ncbi:ATP-dependent RNA helicase DeaD [Ekhidna lutea]|uniref:RNA helicase n=2 Tax=Ekhidna lutea TaxID=447679 RepID=A0A239J310_EKHLU|nr:DEAD/DEAH box helicase [Ekhidna lutea]SNT00217.1 ATP-dependent RNA helicase DeaD [Ekhidna lutea]